jgi:peroxiredoxin-like protein
MNNQFFYETEVQWIGGRRGLLSAEGFPNIEVTAPPEFQGDEMTWTPEHLFVAAVNSCYLATFAAIAVVSRLVVLSFATKATGMLEKVEGRGYRITEIVLKPALLLRSEADVERGTRLLDKALQHCFVSNSIQSEVRLSPAVTFARAAAV